MQYPDRDHAPRYASNFYTWTLVVLAGLSLAVCFNSQGTHDLKHMLGWVDDLRQKGLFAGYRSHRDYPPLHDVVFWIGMGAQKIFGWSDFALAKLLIGGATLLTTYFTFVVTKSQSLAFGMFVILLINGMLLGYTDVLFICALAASVMAYSSNRFVLGSLCFGASFMLKYQPLMLVPFFLAYVVFSRDVEHRRRAVVAIVLPTLICLAFFQKSVWLSLFGAMSHGALSANAFNLGWIVSWVCGQIGLVPGGQIQGINISQVPLMRLLLLPAMLGSYGLVLASFLGSRKSIAELLYHVLIASLCYFAFNRGVHENHLMMAASLGILLAGFRKDLYALAFIFAFSACLNQIVMYGLSGSASFSRWIGFDASLLLAVFNVGLIFCVALPTFLDGIRTIRRFALREADPRSVGHPGHHQNVPDAAQFLAAHAARSAADGSGVPPLGLIEPSPERSGT